MLLISHIICVFSASLPFCLPQTRYPPCTGARQFLEQTTGILKGSWAPGTRAPGYHQGTRYPGNPRDGTLSSRESRFLDSILNQQDICLANELGIRSKELCELPPSPFIEVDPWLLCCRTAVAYIKARGVSRVMLRVCERR